MNQWHPDKFHNDKQKYKEADEKSKIITDAYDIIKRNYLPFLTSEGESRIKVTSSNIHSVGYDINKMILQIQFLNGGVYEYYGVPATVFNELMNAKSKGKFARRYIYYSYRYKRIE